MEFITVDLFSFWHTLSSGRPILTVTVTIRNRAITHFIFFDNGWSFAQIVEPWSELPFRVINFLSTAKFETGSDAC